MHLRAVITGRSKEEINGHRFTILQCKFLDLNYISVKFILCRESTKSNFGLLVCPHSSHWCQGESGNKKNKVPVTHGSSDIFIIGTRRIKCGYKLKWEHMGNCMGIAIISVNPAEFPQGIIWPSIFAFKYRGRKIKESKKLKQMKTLWKGIIVCAVPPAQGKSTWEGLKSYTRYFCQFLHLLLTVWNANLIMQVVKIMPRGMQGQTLTMVHSSPRVRYAGAACCVSAYTGGCWVL